MNRWWIILVGLFCAVKIQAQEIIIQPPVFTDFGCTEFFKLYTGTITNFSQQDFVVDLVLQVEYTTPSGRTELLAEGTLTQNGGITVPPGVLNINNASYESILPIRNITFFNRDIEGLLQRSRCLPPGSYEVCLSLFDHNDASRQRFLTQTCYVREKQILSPILLVSPFDNDSITLDLPLFTWTAVTPFNSQEMYRIQMVEVLVNQTPFEAFRSNPIFYERDGLKTNLFQYAIAARPLNPCMTYAWRVTYELEGRFTGTAFQRNPDFLQQSEIWKFRTGCDKEEEEEKEMVEDLEKYYFEPSLNSASQVYIQTGDTLWFVMDNPYKTNLETKIEVTDLDGEKQLASCCIHQQEDLDDEHILRNASQIVTGKNYLGLDLNSLILKEGKSYTLVIKDRKDDLFINFIYELKDE